MKVPHPRVRSRLALCGVVLSVALATSGVSGAAPTASQARPTASFGATESARLLHLREFTFLARELGGRWAVPYWVQSGALETLVLPAAATPWTLSDLERLAPTRVRSRGAHRVEIATSVAILPGATLRVTLPTTRLDLLSSTTGSASVVSLGGRLDFEGSPTVPLRIAGITTTGARSSARRRGPAAYVLAIGGDVVLKHVEVTGVGSGHGDVSGVAAVGDTTTGFGQASSESPSVVLHRLERLPLYATAHPATSGSGPPSTVVPNALVTPTYTGVVANHDATGLFLANSVGGALTNVTASHNLYDGIDVHFNVSNVTLDTITASHDGANGVALDRGDSNITMTSLHADDDGGYGVLVSGRPLFAAGETGGLPSNSYGSDMIANVEARHDHVAGVGVWGGDGITVRDAQVTGNSVGILISGPSTLINVTDSRVSTPGHHAIALLNGVTDGTVLRNTISGCQTGILIHNSAVVVQHNVVTNAEGFAVALTGTSGQSQILDNQLSGHGFRAIDTSRVNGPSPTLANNDTASWSTAGLNSPLIRQVKRPATLLWLAISGVLLLAWVRRRPWRRERGDVVA